MQLAVVVQLDCFQFQIQAVGVEQCSVDFVFMVALPVAVQQYALHVVMV